MQQQQNYLRYTMLGTGMTIAALLLLYAIPEFDLGSFHFRRINLLTDIIKKEPKPNLTSLDTTPKIQPVYTDTCKQGLVCVEDYTADTSGLDIFLAALDKSNTELVRIAYFADSYVEGDIMLDPLRDTMQAVFGGNGVGYVPLTSEVAAFRQTIGHTYQGWQTYSIVGQKSSAHPLGPAGFTFVPTEGSLTAYKPSRKRRLNYLPSAKLFYGNTEGADVVMNGADTLHLGAHYNIAQLSLGESTQSLTLATDSLSHADFYGVSFESKTGICVDNLSMRGNSGVGLGAVSERMYRNFDSIHPYKLVVLAYGLNVASDKAENYDWYIRSMNKVIPMIKRAFPNSSILLVGCSDRGAKVETDFKTMPGLKEFIDVQRKLAADNQVCFWNMFEAMGGDSTMVEWASTTPPLANKDYTHLTFYGGRKVADLLMGTLLYEREKYLRRKKKA
ncbi:MAG: hypothetical protein JST49_07800 [Bacteroidetes bacterium]|nr:hypothetical protein [Bacteroidota bacterium]